MSQDVLPTQGIFTDQIGNDIGAMFAILAGAMIAAGGGLGGGGVFVPIYILILQYPPKFAAALSQATIFGGSIVNLIMNLKKKHPTRKHRPLTDFSTLLIFEPMLLVGTIIGVLLNVMFPDILILILLALVLSYATLRTSRKGIRLWKKETVHLKNEKHRKDQQKTVKTNIEMQTVQTMQTDHDIENNNKNNNNNNNIDTRTNTNPIEIAAQSNPNPNPENNINIDHESESNHKKTDNIINKLAQATGCDPSQITQEKLETCKHFISRESQIFKPAIVILIVWFFVSLFSILKKESITGIINCGALYWFITFLPFPLMMFVSYFMTKREYNFYNEKINSECWIPAFGDIELSGSFVNISKYPLIASIAGILGGLLGIGGGMIVSPLLIELGVIPTVAAATSAMAVMITSSSAMLQFLLLGFLQWDYTLFFMLIGIVGTFIGQTVVNYAVKEYGRVSVVIFAVAIIMGLAIVLMFINGLVSLVDGVSWAFSAPC